MALTGAVVRLGNATNFGTTPGEASPRGCSAFDGNPYVLGAMRLILMSNLAEGEGEYVSQTLTNDSNIQLFNLGALGEHDGRLYLTDGSDLYVFGDPFRGVFGTADASVDFVGDLNDAGDTLLPKGLASNGTNLHFVYDGGRTGSDIYSINVTDATKTLVGTIAWPAGVTAPRPLGLFYYDGAFHVVERSQGNLYRLSDPDPNNANAMTAARVGTETQFGVSESIPTGCGVFGGSAYLVGSGNDAIYRFIDTDVPTPPPTNNAPAFSETSYAFTDVAIAVGEIVGTVAATDADNDTLSYTLTGTDNSNFAIDANGQITVAVELTNSQVYSFNVVADDQTDTTSVGVSVTAIAAIPPPQALSFGSESIDNQSWVVGTAITAFTLPQATGGVGTKTYSLSPTTPDGITFTAATRRVSGTPTGRFSSATFTYTATDADNNTVQLTFTIVVTAPPIVFNPPTIANQSWVVGTPVLMTLPSASGGVGDLTASLTGTLPQGITFNTATRRLAGNPQSEFSLRTVTYRMTDEEGVQATITFTIIVTVTVVTLSFGVNTIDNQAWVVGDDGTITLPEATGGTGTIAYSLTPALPAGATFDDATRELAYNPTGRFAIETFTYTAIAGTENVTLTFTIVVTAPPIVIPSISNKVWTAGTAVSFTLPVATGGVGAFTYSLSPALPAGISRNVRLITGNPTAAVTVATYTYTAEDSEGVTQTRTFTIIVNAAVVPITFASTIENQIWDIDEAIDTLTLPAAMGGDGTFTYALTPALPTGITRSNFAVTGTPTESFNQTFFRWTATDGNGDTGFTEFTIRVRAAETERNTNPYTYPNEDDVSILPVNRTDFEEAIEAALRYNVLPIQDGHKHNPIIDAWNDQTVPLAHIPCLGINLGLEIDTDLTESQQREILACAWNFHQFAGTQHVILEIIRALGYSGVSISEGVASTPGDMSTVHWANYSIVLNEPITTVDGQAILDLVRTLSPTRSVLVGIDFTQATHQWDGTIRFDGSHTFGAIVDSGLV